jgi:5-methyltetrahydropteroyltriglutamate--homocysteine methyltransferase
MIETANLGFPRIGLHRELKFALERFWSGEWTAGQLEAAAREIRQSNWQMQAAAGIRHIPSNDFSLYDHVLDTAVMTGAIPARYGAHSDRADLPTYFALARGSQRAPAMEMTKWFDTNYHYIVPEFESGMEFHAASSKPVSEFQEARAVGITSRPVLLGPFSFVHLGKIRGAGLSRAALAEALIEPYSQVLGDLAAGGAAWVQIDEPCLAVDLAPSDLRLFSGIYEKLAAGASGINILVAAYYAALNENLNAALRLPVAGLHLDLVRGSEQLSAALAQAPAGLVLSLGVVDGRNVWRTNLDRALELIRKAVDRLGVERIQIAPSCPLLHVPIDLDEERGLDPEVRPWLAFARQKLEEVKFLAQAAVRDDPAIREHLARNREVLQQRARSTRVANPAVRKRVAAIVPEMLRRSAPFTTRRRKQAVIMPLPPLPTTTIGSFPQTAEIRRARAARRSGKMGLAEYDTLLCAEIERAIRFQEETGLDVLVRGEFERSDMVEYFGEQLGGFVFTGNGWVQSYGSRCVKPPVLFGDVSRPKPMTVEWARYAQSLTKFPVKGMLTGPVTIAEWSFVRDDLPKSEVCFQLALVLRDEVADLEVAGIRVIQVDEPALREGLPLRVSERAAYLAWAVDAFRLATAGARDETQIHTHMCYAEFGEILDSIVRMDADVISMEAARSRMELLEAFAGREYPNDIGPGVYDIHSPRVPSIGEMVALIRRALAVFRPEQLWVNPDCGLKTRRWEEVRMALRYMVTAARRVRGALASQPIHCGQSEETGA